MIQPVPRSGVFKVEGYHCWGPQIIKGDAGRYYLAYSRWAKEGGDWLTTSEIAIAVSDNVEVFCSAARHRRFLPDSKLKTVQNVLEPLYRHR